MVYRRWGAEGSSEQAARVRSTVSRRRRGALDPSEPALSQMTSAQLLARYRADQRQIHGWGRDALDLLGAQRAELILECDKIELLLIQRGQPIDRVEEHMAAILESRTSATLNGISAQIGAVLLQWREPVNRALTGLGPQRMHQAVSATLVAAIVAIVLGGILVDETPQVSAPQAVTVDRGPVTRHLLAMGYTSDEASIIPLMDPVDALHYVSSPAERTPGSQPVQRAKLFSLMLQVKHEETLAVFSQPYTK